MGDSDQHRQHGNKSLSAVDLNGAVTSSATSTGQIVVSPVFPTRICFLLCLCYIPVLSSMWMGKNCT